MTKTEMAQVIVKEITGSTKLPDERNAQVRNIVENRSKDELTEIYDAVNRVLVARQVA